MKSRKILLALLIIAIAAVAVVAFSQGWLFKVQNIELISDGIIFENEYLANVSGVKKGQSIFDVNKEKVRANIDATGEYSFENIIILYPSTVKIVLKKRVPAALIEYNGSYLLVDRDGFLIKSIKTASEYDLPVFTGMRISLFSLGNKISTADTYQTDLMLLTIKSLKETGSEKLIKFISFENFSDVYLITHNGKRIDLYEAVDITEKLSLLSEKKLRELIADGEEHKITLYKDSFVVS